MGCVVDDCKVGRSEWVGFEGGGERRGEEGRGEEGRCNCWEHW